MNPWRVQQSNPTLLVVVLIRAALTALVRTWMYRASDGTRRIVESRVGDPELHIVPPAIWERVQARLGDEGDKLIKRVLGHLGGSVTAIYNRNGYVCEMRRALERWANDLTTSSVDEKLVAPSAACLAADTPFILPFEGSGGPQTHCDTSA
jgi:hypothetical protein